MTEVGNMRQLTIFEGKPPYYTQAYNLRIETSLLFIHPRCVVTEYTQSCPISAMVTARVPPTAVALL